MNIGKTLKKLRLERNLTIKEVSQATGFSQSTISEYENNITEPSSKRMFALFDLYGINSIMSILYGKELMDITDFSPSGKQRAYELHKAEKKKKEISLNNIKQ